MIRSKCSRFVMTPKQWHMKTRAAKNIKWLAGGNSHEQNA